MKLSDRLTGLGLVALGVAAYLGGSKLPPVPGQQVGPNVFPMVVGAGLAICGALIALGVGSKFEEEAEAEVAQHADHAAASAPPRAGPAWLDTLRTFAPPLLLLFYVLVVERIGFVPTAFIVVFATSLAMGARLKLALPLAAVAPVLAHLVFYKLLRVPLPAGWLPMPW